jgi:serine/threonine protein kinase/Tfp pilus assembly protein PilF
MIGQSVSHYRILEHLGSGGMGVVYKAEDVRLGRTVALKFLPPELTLDELAKERFLREAQAASALDHPHICTIYGFDQTADGRLFLAMAYYDGETLQRRVAPGPLPPAEAVRIATQIAEGLGKAHAHGIVHRDIKPANVMVTADGQVKLLDFGLAYLPEVTSMTGRGLALGTLSYMAPEQARGDAVDGRVDLWALGVVLYQMLSGCMPFSGDSAPAVLYQILHVTPDPGHLSRAGVPLELSRLVGRALMKDPGDRYQSADEMLSDLRAYPRRPDSGATPLAVDRRLPSIAVLAFSDMSAEKDQDYLCEGIADELINALAGLRGLQVAARSSSFQFKGQAYDVRRIGERLNVQTVLEGAVRKAGSRVRITVQLINASDGYHLWSARYDREIDDVFALQEEIARAVVNTLKVHLTAGSDAPLMRRHTEDREAYHLYLQAQYYWTRRYAGFLPKAMEYFERAIARDPQYGLAHAGLANAYSVLGLYGLLPPKEAFPRAAAAARRALELDDRLPEAHQAMAFVRWFFEWDWAAAEQDFREALALDSSSGLTRAQLAVFLVTQGRRAEALAEAAQARTREPLSLLVGYYSALLFLYAHDYERALEESQRIADLDPHFALGAWVRGEALCRLGRYGEAREAAERAVALSSGAVFYRPLLGRVYAAMGEPARARAVLDELLDRSRTGYVAPLHLADIYVALGEYDRAFACFDGAVEDRNGFLGVLIVDSVYDPVRGDPRFITLLDRVGLCR